MINLVLSTEKINDIQICPLLYFYKHEERKVPSKKESYFETGELIHEILRLYYQCKVDNVQPNLEMIFELGKNFAAKKLALKAEDVAEVIKDARMYFNYYGTKETWKIEGAEEPFAKELWSNENVRIIVTGKVDLRVTTLNGKGPKALVDHKYEARFEKKLERDNQVMCYAWAYDIHDFIYNRIGKQTSYKPEDRLERPYLNLSKFQIEDWKDSAIESALRIIQYAERNKWPMQFHGCSIRGKKCTFYDVCNTTPDNKKYKMDSFFKDRDKGNLMGEEKKNEKTEHTNTTAESSDQS